jgi:hypothetical protein
MSSAASRFDNTPIRELTKGEKNSARNTVLQYFARQAKCAVKRLPKARQEEAEIICQMLGLDQEEAS